MYETMTAIADAVRARRNFKSKLYTVNVRGDGGGIEVLYRGTMVALVMPERNRIFFNTGGWLTSTTKNVLNAALAGAGSNATIFQQDWKWAIRRWSATDSEFRVINVGLFAPFDRFGLPLLIVGQGTLTEAEKFDGRI